MAKTRSRQASANGRARLTLWLDAPLKEQLASTARPAMRAGRHRGVALVGPGARVAGCGEGVRLESMIPAAECQRMRKAALF